MTSAARQEANRANALASTGPRTSAGKAISSRNAWRHGLNLPALRDPALAEEIAALAREIAGPDAGARRFELACRIAAAQIDLVRVRRARHELFSGNPTTTTRRLGIINEGAILAKRTQRSASPIAHFGETKPSLM